MTTIAFDTETFLINKRGKATINAVPRLVCMSWYTSDGEKGLLERERACPLFLSWLQDPTTRLVGHNVTFDLLVMGRAIWEDLGVDIQPYLVDMIEEGARINDTDIRERLIEISKGGCQSGGYSMKLLAKRYLNLSMTDKGGVASPRTRYAELDGVPVEEYPPNFVEYAINDGLITMRIYQAQQARYRGTKLDQKGTHITNEAYQVAAKLSLDATAAWGAMVDQRWAGCVDGYFARQEEFYAAQLRTLGYMREDGSVPDAAKRELARVAWESLGMKPRLTGSGKVAADANTLAELEELFDAADRQLDRRFHIFMAYSRARKMRTTYMEPILDAGRYPLCPNMRVIVNTGRTSSAGPNIQNMPARGNSDERQFLAFLGDQGKDPAFTAARVRRGGVIAADIRGCFVPRPGHVFVASDYDSLEMATLAQVLRNLTGGITAMGRSINNMEDQHCRVAASMLGCSYQTFVDLLKMSEDEAPDDLRRAVVNIVGTFRPKDVRQISKIANYGFAGGASEHTFRAYARGYGMTVSAAQAAIARQAWFDAWPEMQYYFDYISSLEDYRGNYWVEQHGPNRIMKGWRRRRCDKFTQAANSLFQGLAADGAKMVAWRLFKTDLRYLFFVHDEFVREVPAELAQQAGEELDRVMIAGMREFCPDIRINCDYDILVDRWGK